MHYGDRSSTCNLQTYVRDVELTIERRYPKKIGG